MEATTKMMLFTEKKKSPQFALVMSIFLPGFAWAYCGHLGFGIIFLLITWLAWALIVPGLVLHLFAVVYSWKIVKVYNEKLILELSK